MRNVGQNRQLVTTLLCVFLAGGVVGALTMRLGLASRLQRTVSAASSRAALSENRSQPSSVAPAMASPSPTTVSSNDAAVKRFSKELHLSDAQAREIAKILEENRHYYMNLQDQLEDLRATGKNRILQVLDANQRQTFERLASEFQPVPAK